MASLKKNITSLIFVQIFSYIIPLLQLPYLSRVLGVELFGVMAFSLTLIQLVNVLTDYGFNLYLPQLIAGEKYNTEKINELLSNIFIIKIIFSAIGYGIFWSIIFLNSFYDNYYSYLAILSLSIIGNALFPFWVYQGLEQLNVFSKIIISVKLLALFLVIVFVKSPTDFIFLALINSVQVLLLTLICFGVLYSKKIYVNLNKIAIARILELLKNAFPFFISRISVSLYTVGGSVFLGVFSTPIQVAYYNVAEQLYKAGQQVFLPFNQALYPYMMRTKNYHVFKKIIILAVLISCLGAILGWILGSDIIELLFGSEYIAAKSILDVFMITIIINTVAVLMGYPALSPLGLSRKANISVVYSGIAQLIMLTSIGIFVKHPTGKIIVYTILFCEFLTMLYRVFHFYKNFSRLKNKDI